MPDPTLRFATRCENLLTLTLMLALTLTFAACDDGSGASAALDALPLDLGPVDAALPLDLGRLDARAPNRSDVAAPAALDAAPQPPDFAVLTSPDQTGLVDPFIGTRGEGNVIPGAAVPRGLVKLSPDSELGLGTIDAYEWDAARVTGFSHTHLEGPGGSFNGYSQILVVAQGGTPGQLPARLGSAISHDDETASPGYYAVTLQDWDVRAEMTATARCGVHRYTFRRGGPSQIIVDAGFSRGRSLGGEVTLVGGDTVEGVGRYQVNPLISAGLAATDPHTGEAAVYFSARSDHDYAESSGTYASGAARAAFLDLSPSPGEAVVLRVGISLISTEQARANREAECEGRDFEHVRRAAAAAWNERLARVELDGGTEVERRVFTTALYHTFLQPTDASEDGRFFSGWDRQGRVIEAAWRHHIDDWCAWDTARTTHPLHALLDPASREDIVRSYVHSYEAGGWMAKSSWNALGDARCMTGNLQFCIVADAWRKGLVAEAPEALWEAVWKGSTEDSHNALEGSLCGYLNQGTPPDYRDLGYVSHQCDADQSASMTLEYSTSDACAARLAEDLGHDEEAAMLRARSENWRNVFDAALGFARPRNRDGTWLEPFEPTAATGFTEADSWKYTWHVPQDVCALVTAMGGPEAFAAKLDAFFEGGHFDMGNEPDFHTPFLYDFVGQGAKTQDRVRTLLAQHFDDTPGGLPGNDDAGATSAWIVFAMLGLYPVAPADDGYALAAPVFERAVIHLAAPGAGAGDPPRPVDFVIEAPGASSQNRYVQSVTWNGLPLDRPRLAHSELIGGGTLHFELGPAPSGWGEALCP